MILRRLCVVASAVLAIASTLTAQSNSALQDSATFDADGTAHVTRVIPTAATISPEARKWLESLNRESLNQQKAGPETLAERRTRTGVRIEPDHGHAAPHQALRHVRAHPPQSYHAYVQCHIDHRNVEGTMLQEA